MSAVMYSEQNRAFNYAVLASIVLHATLLFGVSQRERTRPAEPQVPIIARLVELPVSVPAAAPPPQAEPVKPRPRAKPVAPKPPLAKEELATPAEAEPEAPAEPVIAEIEPASPAPAAPPVVARADPAPAAAVATAPMPRDAEPVADPGSLEKYRQQLILAAPRYKRYPRMASDNNWAGFVALRMVVAPSGRVASLTVTKTSGHDVLDQQAQEMFRNAAAAVPVPPVLRGKEFAVEVGATYYFTE